MPINTVTSLSDLRSRAEEHIKKIKGNLLDLSSAPEEMVRLINELSVYQIELEMQQAELIQSRSEIETSLNRYTELYECAPTGYVTIARDSTILELNLTATAMFGIERSLLKGHRFISFILAADRPVMNAMIDDVFSSKTHQYCEVTLLIDDAQYPLIQSRLSGHTVRLDAVVSDDGKECRVIVADITERRKAAEAALKMSEDHHRLLFENMLNGIAYCRMIFEDGRPVDFIYDQVNTRFETLTGLKNIEGKKGSEVIPGFKKTSSNMLEIYGRVASTGQPERFEFYGEPLKIWLEISVFSLKKDNFVTIFDNITLRKQADIELKKLSVAIEQSPTGVVITDPLGNIEYLNPMITSMTGYSPDELKGQNPRIFQSGLTSASIYKELWQTILSGEVWRGELQNKKKNGELYWESDVISAVLHHDGSISNFVSVKNDITERKRLLAELSAAKEKVEEAELLKAAFMANISHEMRTPVNGILGFSELLKNPEVSKEEQAEYNDIIHQSGERLLHLINDLIDFSRIEAGETMLHITETSVNKQLKDLQAFFKPAIDKKGLRLRCAPGLPDTESIIETDSSKLSQILTNLIQNALKFTNSGDIDYGYSRKDSMLEFYVSDSGIGIPLNMQGKIFDRFRQVDNTLTQFYKGSGLGLSISKAYVEMLGGTIQVTSTEGQGSTFTFTLPYTTQTPKPSALSTGPSALNPLPSALKILIAEDDSMSTLLMKKMLQGENITILYAVNGRQAVEIIKLHPEINLVLMDVQMPEMSGFEATKLIKQLRPDLPVIIQTALTTKEDREKAQEAGSNSFITKPINKTELLNLIHKLFS